MQKYTLIFGKHSCEAIFQANKREIYEILISNEDNLDLIPEKYKKKIKRISVKEMQKITKSDDKHQNIAMKTSDYIFTLNLEKLIKDLKDNEYSCIFILDEIQDPHNFGAIIRNAFGFDIDAVIITHHRSCPVSLGVLRSSAGYSEMINLIEVKNLANTIDFLKKNDYWIITLDSHENFDGNINDVILKYKKCVFILGSEGFGVREQNKKLSDIKLKIKTNQNIESLNVSSISAIVGHEYFAIKNKLTAK